MRSVEEKLRAIFYDREDDLELRDDLVERLKRQTLSVEAGERGESLDDVISRLGLN